MKLAVVAFTNRGADLAQEIQEQFRLHNEDCQGYTLEKLLSGRMLKAMNGNLAQWTKYAVEQYQGVIFVGACGIAVRAIAPYLKGKEVDPAVLVVDEHGQHVISLLSGHIGGANELSQQLADLIGAKPIVTTATDLNGRFAVDNWAKEQGVYLVQVSRIKHISGAILADQAVGILSEVPIKGSLPIGIEEQGTGEVGICIGRDLRKQPFTHTLNLMPKDLVLGIGCRRGTPKEKIETLVEEVIREHGLALGAVNRVCSIDLKADEEGLLQFCECHRLPFVTYSSEQLAEVEGEFTPSKFVQSVTGVDNVCERSALLGSEQGTLIVRKQAKDGVTVAVAYEGKLELRFDKK